MAYIYNNTPTVSKIKLNGNTKFIKDTEARNNLDSLLNDVNGKANKPIIINCDISEYENKHAIIATLETLPDTNESLDIPDELINFPLEISNIIQNHSLYINQELYFYLHGENIAGENTTLNILFPLNMFSIMGEIGTGVQGVCANKLGNYIISGFPNSESINGFSWRISCLQPNTNSIWAGNYDGTTLTLNNSVDGIWHSMSDTMDHMVFVDSAIGKHYLKIFINSNLYNIKIALLPLTQLYTSGDNGSNILYFSGMVEQELWTAILKQNDENNNNQESIQLIKRSNSDPDIKYFISSNDNITCNKTYIEILSLLQEKSNKEQSISVVGYGNGIAVLFTEVSINQNRISFNSVSGGIHHFSNNTISQFTNDISDLTDNNNIIPTDISQLNDSQGLLPSDYATQQYVDDAINGLPGIPTDISQLSDESGLLSGTDLTGYVQTTDLATVAFSGDYEDLINKPTIPANVSDLTNDTGYITSSDIPEDKIFVVNVTLTSQTEGTADKNATEILAATNNGKIPVVYTTFAGMRLRAFLTYSNSDKAAFVYNDIGGTSFSGIGNMTIDTEGNVTVAWTSGDLAPIESPSFEGEPTAPTAAIGTNTTQIATTEFVQSAISNLGSVLRYKGVKATVSELPTSDNVAGDVWHIIENSGEYAWDGTAWQELGSAIDLSGYALSSNLATVATSGSYNDLSGTPTIDTTITQNSTNAISSGAVYDAIGNIETALEALL